VRCVLGRYERRAYHDSDVVLVNYDSVRRLFDEKWGPRAVRKIPYTSDSAFSPEVPGGVPPAIEALEPREAPLIVSVSRHDPRKGVDRLLHALADLKKAGVPFRAALVSGGPLLEKHRRLAFRLGLGSESVMTGWVPSPQPYLRQASIFVLPSLQEGSGSLSLLEALSEGLPAVVSCVDGIPEDVRHGESALFAEPGDSGGLAKALRRLLGDAHLREKLSGGARRAFEGRFSAEGFTRALAEVYGS
ncbi:MAG: glycosyltransferase family 4 protein, partial [Thermoanaerobaculia bacterium]